MNAVLPGFEQMHIGLVERQCQCGCGEIFFSKPYGRPRLYLNASHKRNAAKQRKASQAIRVGFTDWIADIVKHSTVDGFEVWITRQSEAIQYTIEVLSGLRRTAPQGVILTGLMELEAIWRTL